MIIDNLIGFSATPIKNAKHEELLNKMFGNNIISECTISEAIKNKFINDFKINIHIIDKSEDIFDYSKNITVDTINNRIKDNMWQGKKFINFTTKGIDGITKSKEKYSEDDGIHICSGNNEKDINNDDGKNKGLFVCRKYMEGSDIKGIEFVNIIIEGDIEDYLISQIKGRADRIDYPGQLSEVNIIKYIDDDKTREQTENDLLFRISNILDISIYDERLICVNNEISTSDLEIIKQIELLQEKLVKKREEKKLKIIYERQKYVENKLYIQDISQEKLIDILKKEEIKSYNDYKSEEENLKSKYKYNIDINKYGIPWSELSNNSYYKTGKECIIAIKKIVKEYKSEWKELKKKCEKISFLYSKDNRIPPYNLTECPWDYYNYGEPYDYKLD